MIQTLDVMLWGRKVGFLTEVKLGYKRTICFYYDPEFARSGWDIAPLRAPLHGVAAQKGMPIYGESDKVFLGLPSFIADSLPDRWGHTVFDRWATANGIRKRDLSVLDRLAYTGSRGMGALEFIPAVEPRFDELFKIEIESLSRLAQSTVAAAGDLQAKLSADLQIESLLKVGTSAGGMRPKAVINYNAATGECFSGQVSMSEPGFKQMLIKFDEHTSMPTARIEYSYYLMARAAGLTMMNCILLELGNEVHFMTERYDRVGNGKLHVQTLAAMNPLADSYEDLFDVAVRLNVGPLALGQLFLQMVMNVLCGNVDDHNKNFSFIMGTDGVWHIAPCYDFTFTVDLGAPSYVNRHSMSINGMVEDIGRQDLMAIAQRYSIKSAETMIDRAMAVAANYAQYAESADVPTVWSEAVQRVITERIGSL